MQRQGCRVAALWLQDAVPGAERRGMQDAVPGMQGCSAGSAGGGRNQGAICRVPVTLCGRISSASSLQQRASDEDANDAELFLLWAPSP